MRAHPNTALTFLGHWLFFFLIASCSRSVTFGTFLTLVVYKLIYSCHVLVNVPHVYCFVYEIFGFYSIYRLVQIVILMKKFLIRNGDYLRMAKMLSVLQ